MPRKLPNWLAAYMRFTTYTEAPAITHMWTAVSTIGGALRRKVWFPMGFFEWSPCFYIIIVGRAGTITKSTTINIGMDMLKELNINFGPSVVTWQALVSDLAKSSEGIDINDDGVIETFSPITIAASEFGTFLDPRNREFVDVLVDLWDGRRTVWEKKTKTSGNDAIQNPWINLIAATTPSWLAENFPESMIGGGFTSRCVFVFGAEKSKLVPYPAKQILPQEHKQLRLDLLADLEHISMMKGAYELAPEAETWGIAWYERLHDPNNAELSHLNDERFDAYRSRRQTHLHKLALVLAASKRDERVILLEDFKEADAILTATEKESLPAVFNNIGKSDSGRLIDRLMAILRKHGRVKKSTLIGDLIRFSDPRTVNDIINGAVSAGYITQLQLGANVFLELSHVAPEA